MYKPRQHKTRIKRGPYRSSPKDKAQTITPPDYDLYDKTKVQLLSNNPNIKRLPFTYT